MESIIFEVRNLSPMLMHRYTGAQPSKEKPPKGKKTQAHIEAEYKSDWLQSAYWQNGTFYIPSEVVEAAIAEAAKDFRLGKTSKRAIAVEEFFLPLRIFKSETDLVGFHASGELKDWYKPPYVDIRGVRIGPSKIDRCRPQFLHWGLTFTVKYDPEKMSREHLIKSVEGISIGDFRPRYGRIKIVSSCDVQHEAA